MTLALSLFFVWLSLRVLQAYNPSASRKTQFILLLFIAPLVAYPFMYGPVWWLRGLTGDLSILTLCLLLAAVYQQLFGRIIISAQEQRALRWGIVVLGLAFYPLALGLGSFDPYALGYASILFVGLVLSISLVLFAFKYQILASILVFCVLAWQMQLLQSVNLWDYLIDPFVFFLYLWRFVRCK